jgi:hypothetical protein
VTGTYKVWSSARPSITFLSSSSLLFTPLFPRSSPASIQQSKVLPVTNYTICLSFQDHGQGLTKKNTEHRTQNTATMPSPDERRPSTFLRLTPDLPTVSQRRGSFLTLAPATSPSYPQMPIARPAASAEVVDMPRRKSSVGNSPKILKLGPVHWGEHLDEHKDDFHEIA